MSDRKHRYTILSMMKDEGHCLIEWLAYHHHLGFDNICVYTNNCTDGTDKMLMRLAQLGYCRHFENVVPADKKPQPHALQLASKNPDVTDSDWVLTMDADEFLSIKVGDGRLPDLIAALPEGTDALAITWRFFGSSEITDWNPGLVSQTFTRAAPDDFKKGWGVKTLFRPYEDLKLGIHRPHIRKAKQQPEKLQRLMDQHWVNGSGVAMPTDFNLSGWRSTKPTLGYDLVEMNHYAVKSYEAYLLRRMRGNVNNKADKYNANYFAIFDRNEIVADNAARHAEAVKQIMAQMLADPELRALQDAANAFHAAQVERLRTTGEYDDWLASLKQASLVPMDKLDEILFTQHLPKMWQEKVEEWRTSGVPDKEIALMIARSQTARKAETRAALREVAGAPDEGAPNTPEPDPTPPASGDQDAETNARKAEREERRARRKALRDRGEIARPEWAAA
ncbi:glycosyltransferase family 2 protein, partial [Actibacterium sp.]|uniref:glycosyltransferase family 2 protein n=1 Tax=Actibacterium sp. TaxID=1872125 RepID=UPI0035668660